MFNSIMVPFMKTIDTLIMRPFRTSLISTQKQLDTNPKLVYPVNEVLKLVKPDVENVAGFNVPIVNSSTIYIDGRSYYKADGSIRNARGLKEIAEYAALDYMYNKSPSDYIPVANLLAVAFANWTAQSAGRRYNLNLHDLEIFKMTMATYYFGLCYPSEVTETLKESDFERLLSTMLIGTLRMSHEFVSRHLEGLVELVSKKLSLDAHLAFAFSNSMNTNFSITPPALIMLLSDRAWMGFNAKEYAGIAIENPAYLANFIRLYHTLGFYRKTGIGSVLELMKRMGTRTDNVRTLADDLIIESAVLTNLGKPIEADW